MGKLRRFIKLIYLLLAVGIGVGCFYSFLFFILNIGDGLISRDNKPAAYGVAAVALLGTILFLVLGRVIYKSNSYVGTTVGIIFVAAILTMPTTLALENIKGDFQAYRAKPYLESYINDLEPIFAEQIASLEFDENESKSATLSVWKNRVHDIWINLRKKEGTLSSKEIEKVIDALPPAKYDVRVFIYYESHKDYPAEYKIDFTRRNNLDDPPYCQSDDFENKPCDFFEGLK